MKWPFRAAVLGKILIERPRSLQSIFEEHLSQAIDLPMSVSKALVGLMSIPRVTNSPAAGQ